MSFISDFRHLEGIGTLQLCNTFNLAFSDYIVPIHLTPSLMEQKIFGENLKMDYSIGAFNSEELGGFILHGVDHPTQPTRLYNGGTGVIPSYRKQRLVQKMYDQFLPGYKEKGIRKISLEVISTNLAAIKAYENSGFVKTRRINSHKGDARIEKWNREVKIERMPHPNWEQLGAFIDMEPTWANSFPSLKREGALTTTWVAELNGQTVGYISIHMSSRRIRSIGVAKDFRRQGIGSALLQHAGVEVGNPLTIINIDENNPEISAFLEKAGLKHYLWQYEMVLDI